MFHNILNTMKVVIPGGSGAVGAAVKRHFVAAGHAVVILSRHATEGHVQWDGRTIGDWAREFNDADVVLNLAGRTVNCRYSEAHLKEMMDSRVESTRVVGQAIARAKRPPPLWLQASTATIYAHRFDAPNDEFTGIIGGQEPDVPALWKRSIDIALAWEEELDAARTPGTRKVALRSAMVMSADKGSIFDVLSRLARRGLSGKIDGGRQYVSWIHEHDFCAALDFLIAHPEIDGPVNLASPNPLPQAEFAQVVREAWRVPIGLPLPAWMLEIGCFLMQTESELVMKSRRVVPGRLLKAGFEFKFPEWRQACKGLSTAPSTTPRLPTSY